MRTPNEPVVDPKALSSRTLAALLAAAQSEGLAGAVLNLLCSPGASQQVLQRLRKLGQQVDRAGAWGYLAQLLEAADELVRRQGQWRRPEQVLAAPVPSRQHLLAALRCRRPEVPGRVQRLIREVRQELEHLGPEPGRAATGPAEVRALCERIERMEAQLARLCRAGLGGAEP